jgi:nucleoid DNA-binding protein
LDFSFLEELDLHLTKNCNTLVELIQKYILQHHSVSIEGWGTISLENQPAALDFPNRQVHAPVTTLHFSTVGGSNRLFTNWVADELRIKPEEATQRIQSFVQAFSNTISKESVTWSGWGTFEKKGTRIGFTAATETVWQPASVSAEKIIRKGAGHQVRVGEDERSSVEMEELLHPTIYKKKHLSRIIALFFTAAGIILAVLFASKHNTQWKNYTRYQPLHLKEPPVLYKTP